MKQKMRKQKEERKRNKGKADKHDNASQEEIKIVREKEAL